MTNGTWLSMELVRVTGAVAVLKCLGGEIQGRLVPSDDAEDGY